MTTYGITDSGFTLKRLADVISDMVTALSTVQDAISGEYLTPDLTDENDPLVQIVNAHADLVAVTWEQLQVAYNQFDPLKATGAGLSGLVQLNGLRRLLGTYATVTFGLTGTPSRYIAAGVQISDMNDLYIFELPAFTFDGGGTAVVIGTCTVKGSVVALTGTLVKILTPTSGLSSAFNLGDSTGGSDDETDADLRARQQLSTAGTAKSIIDALYSNLAGITDVTHVRVYQNRTLTTDVRGIPGKTVAAVVLGGDSEVIAAELFTVMGLGLDTHGNTSVTETDEQGIEYAINFTRPNEVDIYIDIELEIVLASLWPTDGADNIKEYILQWAADGAAGIGVTDGLTQAGYQPGQTIYASELYIPVGKQLGIRIASLTVGTSHPAMFQEVFIDWNEIASFSSANIAITYVEESS